MTVFLDEKSEVIELRRSQDALGICGKGTLILLLWSFARFLMSVNIEDAGVAYMQKAIESSGAVNNLEYWLIFLILAAIIIAVHSFVAFRAIAESRGKKKGYFYQAVCVLLMAGSVWGIVSTLTDQNSYTGMLDNILNICVDALSLVVETGIIVNSFKVKKLKSILGEEAR